MALWNFTARRVRFLATSSCQKYKKRPVDFYSDATIYPYMDYVNVTDKCYPAQLLFTEGQRRFRNIQHNSHRAHHATCMFLSSNVQNGLQQSKATNVNFQTLFHPHEHYSMKGKKSIKLSSFIVQFCSMHFAITEYSNIAIQHINFCRHDNYSHLTKIQLLILSSSFIHLYRYMLHLLLLVFYKCQC